MILTSRLATCQNLGFATTSYPLRGMKWHLDKLHANGLLSLKSEERPKGDNGVEITFRLHDGRKVPFVDNGSPNGATAFLRYLRHAVLHFLYDLAPDFALALCLDNVDRSLGLDEQIDLNPTICLARLAVRCARDDVRTAYSQRGNQLRCAPLLSANFSISVDFPTRLRPRHVIKEDTRFFQSEPKSNKMFSLPKNDCMFQTPILPISSVLYHKRCI